MESNSQFRLAGWCGYISAGATIFGFVTFMIFFIVGDPFGIMNDIASVVIALTGIPILLALHRHFRSGNFAWSVTALVIGVISLLVAAVTQTMLVFKVIEYEQTVPATIGFGMFGIALIIFGLLSYRSNIFSRRISTWGILAGLGYFLVVVGFLLGQQNHPLSYVGGLMSVVAFPTWAVMLGRVFLTTDQESTESSPAVL